MKKRYKDIGLKDYMANYKQNAEHSDEEWIERSNRARDARRRTLAAALTPVAAATATPSGSGARAKGRKPAKSQLATPAPLVPEPTPGPSGICNKQTTKKKKKVIHF